MADIIIKKKTDKIADNKTKYIIDYTSDSVVEVDSKGNAVSKPQHLNTEDTYIIDGERYKYNGDKLVIESEMYSVDPKEQTKTNSEFYEKLPKISKNTKDLIDSINLPLSSFEVFLPLILDNFTYFNNNTSLNFWLRNHGFIDKNNEVLKREVTLDEATAFAGRLIALMNSSGAQNILNFKAIFPNYDSPLGNTDTSVKDIISTLRFKGDVYTSEKDIALKNFSVKYKDAGISRTLSKYIKQLIQDNTNLNNLLDNLEKFDDNNIKRLVNLCKESTDFGYLSTNLENLLDAISELDADKRAEITDIAEGLRTISENYNINNISLVLEHIQNAVNQIYLNENSEDINKDLSNIKEVLLSKVELLYKNLGNLNKLVKEVAESDVTKQNGAAVSDAPAVLDISPKGWNRFILRNNEVNPIVGEDINAWEDLLSIRFDELSDARSAVDSILTGMKDTDSFKFKSLAYDLNRESVLSELQKHFIN
jgi:hypothetical protein